MVNKMLSLNCTVVGKMFLLLRLGDSGHKINRVLISPGSPWAGDRTITDAQDAVETSGKQRDRHGVLEQAEDLRPQVPPHSHLRNPRQTGFPHLPLGPGR